jgi:thioredoxin reductase
VPDTDTDLDVLVVGGGPAGLAAGLWLGRHRFDTVIADRGEHRNRGVEASFGYLGFDGRSPRDILDAGVEELRRYPSVQLVTSGVRTVHRDGDGFCAELDDRIVRSSSVIFATGVSDGVPPLPGLRDHFGTSVFVCPLCDGYEVRDRHVAVLGAGGAAADFAEELLRWTSRITIVPLAGEAPTGDVPDDVTVATHSASEVIGADRLEGVKLEDGTTVACDAIFLRSPKAPHTDLAAHLGCDLDADGLIVTDDDGCTSIPDVYAAGDCTPGPQIVQVAAAKGARAGLRCAQTLMSRRVATS